MPFYGTPEHYEDGVLQGLLQMRGLLERGWTQHMFMKETDNGPTYCLIGALSTVKIPWDTRVSIKNLLLRARPLWSMVMSPLGLDHWNDMPWRTKENVLDLVDRAIALRRKKVEARAHSLVGRLANAVRWKSRRPGVTHATVRETSSVEWLDAVVVR